MERIKRNLAFLKEVKNKSKRLKALKEAKPDTVKLFSDCACNLLKGNLKVHKNKLAQLKKLKNGIRLLAKKSVSLKKKKRVLLQRGGAIASLLIPIITTIASLLIK